VILVTIEVHRVSFQVQFASRRIDQKIFGIFHVYGTAAVESLHSEISRFLIRRPFLLDLHSQDGLPRFEIIVLALDHLKTRTIHIRHLSRIGAVRIVARTQAVVVVLLEYCVVLRNEGIAARIVHDVRIRVNRT